MAAGLRFTAKAVGKPPEPTVRAPVLDPTCERLRVKFPGSTHPYIKVKGSWKYLYRAVNKAGNTIDFLFRAKRDRAAAQRFFEKAIGQNGSPETVTTDKSGSNLAALHAENTERETPIKIRQVKYLNNVVEQDHRAVKRITRPMQGFKDFDCARVILSGIETMHMIKKGQMKCLGKIPLSAAQQFYSLVS